MLFDRKERKGEQIKEIAARIVERESNRSSLITITRVELDERSRKGMIFFTVMPETAEDAALNFLKRKRAEIHDTIKEKLSFHPIPFLDVSIDRGEKSRQNIEALLKE